MIVKEIDQFEFINTTFLSLNDVPLIENCDFSFPMNSVVRIKGAHGSGKSLLLKALAGLVSPVEGSYLINGNDIARMRFADAMGFKLNMGYGNGAQGLLANRTVRQNLMLPLRYHRINETEANRRTDQLIEYFGIGHVQDMFPGDLSVSYRRLSVLSRAFILKPKVLLLDNPAMGLDLKDHHRLSDFIKEERKTGRLRHVFLVSQEDRFIESLVTNQVLIKDKKLTLES